MECHYCGRGHDLNHDHVVPIARGGLDVAWNIVTSCRNCNAEKGHNWPSCACVFCTSAIERHPQAFRGARLRDRPAEVLEYAITARPSRGGVGPRCPDCGDITMTPWDCPWCRNGAVDA